MQSDTYLKVIATIFTVGVLYLGAVGINAVDRLHRSNVELSKLLRNMKSDPSTAAVSAVPAEKNKSSDVNIANLRYFDPQARFGGKMTRAISAEPPNFNMIICNEATAITLGSLCTAGLAERNWENPDVFEPMIAESWQISQDKKVFDIKLRKGVKYNDFTDPVTGRHHKNVEVTAHDFKFMVDVIKDEKVNCAHLKSYYQDLEKIEVINDYEFKVYWSKPFYGSVSCTLSLQPLPRHFYAPDGKFDGEQFNSCHLRNKMIVGAGPYQLDKWEKAKKLTFKRNLNYFGTKYGIAPPLHELHFEVISLPGTRYQALMSGKIDSLNLTPEQWIKRSVTPQFAAAGLRKEKYLLPQYTYIGYNQKNPLFQDKKVRQALTHLVDRNRICRDIYHDLAEVAVTPFFPKSRFSNPNLKAFDHSPEKAKKLLAEAGWKDVDGDGILEKDNKKFRFTMLQIASHPTQQKLMPLLKEAFAAAGIDMSIQVIEWSNYLQRLDNRSYDACCLGWSSSFDPDMYQVWHSSQMVSGGSNHISYRNTELDKLIETMRQEFDTEKRIALAHKIGSIIHEDQPYTFLVWPYSLTAVSEKFSNLNVYPAGMETMPAYLKEF